MGSTTILAITGKILMKYRIIIRSQQDKTTRKKNEREFFGEDKDTKTITSKIDPKL